MNVLSSGRGRGAAVVALAAASVIGARPALAQLRAFGEAEGYGAAASGGRGITAATSIYHVTNLNDSGTGSLRDAVSGSNRIVVFDVGGEIKLTTGGISSQSNVTIAGQTAPGAGITITGAQALGFTSRTNVIARYLRMRPGDTSSASDNGMSMTRTGTAILDHVSIEFGKYNNIDAVAQTADLPRITIQNSIIADPISTGTDDRGQGFGAHLEAVNGYYTISNNLWANAHSRNPLAKVNDQFKNNVEYNNEIGFLTSGTSSQFDHDLVNNAFIAGPNYTSGSDYGQLSTPDKFYAVGNVQDANRNGVFDPSISNPVASTDSRYSATPIHPTTLGLPTLSVTDAYAYVLAHAGSSLSRDALDNLVIGQVQTLGSGTAGYTAGTTGPLSTTVPFDTVHEGLYWKAYLTGLSNGGLGDTASSSRPAGFDADNDGVADAWEALHGMSSATAADAVKQNPLGYLMIEQYLNELGDQNATAAWTNPAADPGPYTHAVIRGTGATSGVMVYNATPAVAAAPQMLSLSLGGNGPASGESLTVTGGRLNVYDTVTVGEFNNATLNVTGGTMSAWNVQLGNTVSGTTYTGSLNLSGGTLLVDQIAQGGGTPGAWTTGGQVNFTGGTIKAAGALSLKAPIAVSGTGGTVDTSGFDGVASGTISGNGGITKAGNGVLTLSGNNTYTGVTRINAGSLAVAVMSNAGAPGNLGASSADPANLVFDGGTLRYNGTTTTATDRAFTMTAKGATLDAGSTGQWQFNGTGNIAQSGTGNRTLTLTGSTTNSNFALGLGDPTSGKTSLTLAGSSTSARWIVLASATPRTYSGDTTIAAGTLLTNASNVLPFGNGRGNLVLTSASSALELNGNSVAINGLSGIAGTVNQRGSANRTLTLGNGDATASFAGTLSQTALSGQGTLSITKVGTGTQTLSGPATYTGVTTIQGGILKVSGVSSSNLLTNAGGVDLQNGKVTFDYTGGTSPVATIRTLLAASYNAPGGHWTGGQFDSGTATATRGLGYADAASAVTVVAMLYGDADLDGGVSINDFNILAGNFGTAVTAWTAGDFDYDGGVSINDFNLLAANFGQMIAVGGATPDYSGLLAFAAAHNDLAAFEAVTGVPEPTVSGLMVVGSGLMLRRRQTRTIGMRVTLS